MRGGCGVGRPIARSLIYIRLDATNGSSLLWNHRRTPCVCRVRGDEAVSTCPFQRSSETTTSSSRQFYVISNNSTFVSRTIVVVISLNAPRNRVDIVLTFFTHTPVSSNFT